MEASPVKGPAGVGQEISPAKAGLIKAMSAGSIVMNMVSGCIVLVVEPICEVVSRWCTEAAGKLLSSDRKRCSRERTW